MDRQCIEITNNFDDGQTMPHPHAVHVFDSFRFFHISHFTLSLSLNRAWG